MTKRYQVRTRLQGGTLVPEDAKAYKVVEMDAAQLTAMAKVLEEKLAYLTATRPLPDGQSYSTEFDVRTVGE